MGRSKQLRKTILEGRNRERTNLNLCEELYLYQMQHGEHFHLEQPVGSEMLAQPELEQVRLGTLTTIFDMCEVGRLNWKGESLRKRTTILTTSRQMHEKLDCRYCSKDHEHRQIAGQVKSDGIWMPLSSFAAKYTAGFARNVLDVVQKHPKEMPLYREELNICHDGMEVDPVLIGEVLKRRRLFAKQTQSTEDQPTQEEEVKRKENRQNRLRGLFEEIEKLAPRVGTVVLPPESDVFRQAKEFCEFRLRHAEICRGTERLRTPQPSTPLDELEFRKTLSVCRKSGEIEQVGGVERWKTLSQRQKIRKGIPAKLTLTLFGNRPEDPSDKQTIEDTKPSRLGGRKRQSMQETNEQNKRFCETLDNGQDQGGPTVPGSESETLGKDLEDDYIEGKPPRNLARHGPGFLSLEKDQQKWLRQVHHRLGHPDAETLVRYLRSTEAEPAVLDGARDYQCDACLEARKGFDLPQAGAIHEDIGFNHTLGIDGVTWTNANGTNFEFTHVIDEGTLFHVARPCGSDSTSQWTFLEEFWFSWAGYPKVLYVDPARGYLSEQWMDRTQEVGISLVVSARDSHWQLGRVEAHGEVLKGMLSRMDAEKPINDAETFRKALNQACFAKNTLMRKSGYSPEQAVLGRSSRLPGSVLSADDSITHAKVLDEGQNVFKETLDMRESARKAFIHMDNSNSLRRVMLRRSRPVRADFEVGDLVLYWKRKGGNMRRERGQWFGPARVVLVEGKRVIWLVHAHRLVRASPQQLRAASMREWKGIKDKEEFKVPPKDCARKIGHQDFFDLDPDDLPDLDNQEYTPSENSGGAEASGEQIVTEPEEEVAVPSHRGSMDEGENIPMDGVEVPIPDDPDDKLFGDTILFQQHFCQEYMWEMDITPAFCVEPELFETPDDYILAAVNERKKKTEVRLKELSQEDQKRFAVAKHKELRAWLQHKTTSGGEPPEDISTEGKKAKARLIVIGWEDPELDSVVNDAPTLTKDGRMVVLQGVASHNWPLISFDVSTAFLHGKGDGRPLGLVPVPEMRDALGMSDTDQVQLDGGAYGRIDAPFLWFCEFRDELLAQGCRQSPLDPCVFTYHSQDGFEGCLGIHVDDGIGGGSEKFMKMLTRVEARSNLELLTKVNSPTPESDFDNGMTSPLSTTRLNTLKR